MTARRSKKFNIDQPSQPSLFLYPRRVKALDMIGATGDKIFQIPGGTAEYDGVIRPQGSKDLYLVTISKPSFHKFDTVTDTDLHKIREDQELILLRAPDLKF